MRQEFRKGIVKRHGSCGVAIVINSQAKMFLIVINFLLGKKMLNLLYFKTKNIECIDMSTCVLY